MKIERDRADIFHFARPLAYVADSTLVDLVYRHIEADIVGRGVLYILHNGIVCIAAYHIVPFFIAVKAEQYKIRFGQINGKSSVGDDIDDHKSHFLRLDHKIPERSLAVSPEKCLAAAEEQDANAHIIEPYHLAYDLLVWMNDRRDIVDRAVLTFQITFVGDDHRAEDRVFPLEQDST